MMMMDDLLGNIHEGGAAGGGNDQQQQAPQQQAAAAPQAQGQDDFMAEMDLLLQMDAHPADQQTVGEGFLSGHLSRLQERTSMLLTEDEARWAQELKGAVEASQERKLSADNGSDQDNDHPTLPPLSDMAIAQSAIVAQGHVLQALHQMHALQAFKDEYDIDDSVQQGMESVAALMEQQPHVFLDVDTNPQTQESVIVMDQQAFVPSKAKIINSTGDGTGAEYPWKVLMRGYYYLYRACSSSLASIRNGLFLVVDCHGMGWENFDLETEQRFQSELGMPYPMRWKKIMGYNTAMVATVCWGLVKRLRGPAFGAALELNCRLVDTDASRPPRRMAELYQQPNAKAMTDKVLRRVQELLQARDIQEAEFQMSVAVREAAAGPLLR